MKKLAFLTVLLSFLVSPAQASQKKTAFIVANWAAPAFYNEAAAVQTQLQRLGWVVYFFDTVSASDGLTVRFAVDGREQSYTCSKKTYCGWQTLMTHFLPADSVKNDDRVFIDVQGDGTTNTSYGLTLADGKSLNFNGLSIDMDTALSYEEFATSYKYPIDSLDTLATHSVEAYFSNMKKTNTGSEYMATKYGSYLLNMISTGDLSALAKLYAGKGARVTVIDHSCQGGSTTKLLESLHDDKICGVSTTGIDSPGIQGTPPLSQFLSSHSPNQVTADAFAHYVTNFFYNTSGYYNVVNRIHQLGFSSGCTKTMPLREMSDNAAWAYSTWWDWNRARPSHVVRTPSRYVYPASASALGGVTANPVWTKSTLDPSFAADCKAAKKNCDIKRNPRMNIADGWVRWFQENLEAFQKSESASAARDAVVFKGQMLLGEIYAYGVTVQRLDDALTAKINWIGFGGQKAQPADAYLRKVFTEQCLCNHADAIAQLKLTCPKDSHDYTSIPNNWSQNAICSNPTGFVTNILGYIPARYDSHGKLLYNAPNDIASLIQTWETASDGPGNTGMMGANLSAFSQTLVPYEENCTSKACSLQAF